MRTLVDAHAGWTCCGEAGDPESTLTAVEKSTPDLILLDFFLNSGEGIDLIKEIRRRCESIFILMLSRTTDPEIAERALRAGADGFVLKDESPEQITVALEQTIRGENYLSQAISGQVLKRMLDTASGVADDLSRLSDREFQVLQLLGQGLGNKQIASELHLSPKTIGTYREHLKVKLKLPNSQQLLIYAARRFDGSRKEPHPGSDKGNDRRNRA